jgi:hypothetical protein
MKNRKLILFLAALILIGGTAGALAWLRTNQKLGQPGIKATPLPGQVAMEIYLPENVTGFTSTNVPESEVELNYFPKDTSYVRRAYQSHTGGYPIYSTIVMMGADRTSIHKPDYCLPGQGWTINERTVVKVPIAGGGYELPVAKWTLSNSFLNSEGTPQTVHGIYAFWFVAEGEQTPDHYQRLWWLTRDLLRHGVLQRWAYVSYFAPCLPGEEDVTFERMKNLIANSVPAYQIPPGEKRAAGGRTGG